MAAKGFITIPFIRPDITGTPTWDDDIRPEHIYRMCKYWVNPRQTLLWIAGDDPLEPEVADIQIDELRQLMDTDAIVNY